VNGLANFWMKFLEGWLKKAEVTVVGFQWGCRSWNISEGFFKGWKLR